MWRANARLIGSDFESHNRGQTGQLSRSCRHGAQRTIIPHQQFTPSNYFPHTVARNFPDG